MYNGIMNHAISCRALRALRDVHLGHRWQATHRKLVVLHACVLCHALFFLCYCAVSAEVLASMITKTPRTTRPPRPSRTKVCMIRATHFPCAAPCRVLPHLVHTARALTSFAEIKFLTRQSFALHHQHSFLLANCSHCITST